MKMEPESGGTEIDAFAKRAKMIGPEAPGQPGPRTSAHIGGSTAAARNVRDKHPEFGSRSFVFPQMQIEKSEREQFGVEHWRPGFVDYLFIAFTQSSTFGPTDAPLLARWAKLLTVVQISISLSIVILLIARAVGVL